MSGVAVVTGANSGIGLATAARLAGDGHEVFAGSRSEAGLEDIDRAASELGLPAIHPVRLDVTDDDSVAAAFDHARSAGPVSILVNNAGIAGTGAVETTPISTYQATFDTNVLGIIRCCQQVLPAMREAGAGRIVNISSAVAIVSPPLMSAYGLSKFAVEGLSESLQSEVAPHGIRVIVVRPGTILTPIWAKAEPFDPDDPYRSSQDYVTAVVTHNLTRTGVPAEAVAEVIGEAVAAAEPAMRYEVGDAELQVRLRSTFGDEDLFGVFFLEGEAFRSRYTEITGIDYWP